MAMLKHELAPLGPVWSSTADRQLVLGAVTLNGREDLVDAVKDLTGAAATIFLGDTRIATNVPMVTARAALGRSSQPAWCMTP